MNPVRPDQPMSRLGRWSDGGSTGPAESAAQELFSQGARGTPPPPSPAHLDKLWTGAAKAAAAGAGTAAAISVGTKVLFAALATGGAATAWVALQGDGVNTPPTRPAVVSPAPPRVAPVAPPVPTVPAPVVAPPVPTPQPQPQVPAVTPKPRVAKTEPAKPDVKTEPTPPPGLAPPPLVPLPTAEADDSDLVVRAASELKRGEPTVALRTLQERQDRFGPTKHAGPVGLLKTEALRELGRLDEALEELARLERDGVFPPGRLRELPLIRAELLVAAKRCNEAVPLFEKLVDDRTFSARARTGLAACGEPLP